MQKKRDFKNKFIASLIVFMLAFSNFATLGSALVSYAADDSSDVINYSAQFVMITNTQDEDQTDQTEDTTTDVQVSTDEANSSVDTVGSVEQNVVDEEQSQDDVENPVEDTTSENVLTEPDENTVDTEKDNMTDEEFNRMKELGFEYAWQLLDMMKDGVRASDMEDDEEYTTISEYLDYV